MSRKKETDPKGSMEALLQRATALAGQPFAPGRDAELPSLREVAAAMDTTLVRARKLLITAGWFSSPLATQVQRLRKEGKTVQQIGQALRLGQAAVYGYLPYSHGAYNLPQTSGNADRHKRYRATIRLKAAVEKDDWGQALWQCVCCFNRVPFRVYVPATGKTAVLVYHLAPEQSAAEGARSGTSEVLCFCANGARWQTTVARPQLEQGFARYLGALRQAKGNTALAAAAFEEPYLPAVYQRFCKRLLPERFADDPKT